MMSGLSGSELLFYGGLIGMAAAVIAATLSMVLFIFSGRKLNRKLDQEYGMPKH